MSQFRKGLLLFWRRYLNSRGVGLGILLMTMYVVSCKKSFLDVPPTTTVIRDYYVTDLSSCESMLNGVYVMLQLYVYHGFNSVYADIVADNVKPYPGKAVFMNQYNWNQIANEENLRKPENYPPNLNSLWTAGYAAIRQCDFLLENVDRFRQQNADKADNIKGQAYGIRALIHHQLVNVFAQPYRYTPEGNHPGVPYITVSDYTKEVRRQTVKEVYDAIIDDLNNAVVLLANSYSGDNLHFNRNAAKALLARVKLYKGDYRGAKDLSVEVAASVPVTNENYPMNLFTPNEKEALFQLPPNQNGSITIFPSFYFRMLQDCLATDDIVSIIRERPLDLRNSWINLSGTDWLVTKFPTGVNPSDPYPELSYYLTIVRSSEMYLTAAECYAQLGDFDSSYYYLDAIRQRADRSAPTSTAVGSALLDSIYKERRKELAFEGTRLFDLLRIGKGVYRSDAASQLSKELIYPSNKAIAPIPLNDVNLSGLEQNPSY